MGFLNRTGAEIGYELDKKCKERIFYYGKNSKIPKVPSSVTKQSTMLVCSRKVPALLALRCFGLEGRPPLWSLKFVFFRHKIDPTFGQKGKLATVFLSSVKVQVDLAGLPELIFRLSD